MIQSARGIHVGIVMDGNGRWATRRGLARPEGHLAGARQVHEVVEAAASLGVGTLTLFAFSADNWKRPASEVGALMALFERELVTQAAHCRETGIGLNVIGRRDRLPVGLVASIETAEATTRGGAGMRLRIALDYSARGAIRRAAARVAATGRWRSPRAFRQALARAEHAHRVSPAVDVFIRTGGERRLSDFLLWESAYAELFFRVEPWPEFGREALAQVLDEFRGRERRFGALVGVPSIEEQVS